jgi:hypothetical protein
METTSFSYHCLGEWQGGLTFRIVQTKTQVGIDVPEVVDRYATSWIP